LRSNDYSRKKQKRSPRITGTVESFLENLRVVVEGIASIFPDNCEVVLHDLRHPEHSIVAIANGHVSGRKIGGPIIGGPLDDKGLKIILDGASTQNIVSNYTSQTRDGRKLKSTSIFFRNAKGVLVIALCMNLDLTEFRRAKDLLEDICSNEEKGILKKTNLKGPDKVNNNVSQIIKNIVDEATIGLKEPIRDAKRNHKLAAIKIMYERGLFFVRGGVDYAARALGVSRFTIYNYLREFEYRQ
jgi:predicted transcriptional regulator YheO